MSKAAIEEYCRICQEKYSANYRTSSEARQEEMLEELLQRSRSDFGRSVLANITGDFAYDILKVGLKGLTKIF